MMRGQKRVKGTALAKQQALVTPGEDEGRDFQFLTALARGLRVLEACIQAPKPIGTGELAAIAELSLPNVSRITYTLTQCGYLQFNGRDRTYVLGPQAAALAATIRRRTEIHGIARGEMEKLAEATGFNVGIGTMAGDQIVYLDAFEGASPVGLKLQAGYQVPLATSAVGRAYLAGLSEGELAVVLDRLKSRYADEWSSLERRIDAAMTQVHTTGYCVSIGEWNQSVNAIAAPLRDPKSEVLYAVVLGGPAYLLTPEVMTKIAPDFLGMMDTIGLGLSVH